MARPFSELRDKMSPEARERAERRGATGVHRDQVSGFVAVAPFTSGIAVDVLRESAHHGFGGWRVNRKLAVIVSRP